MAATPTTAGAGPKSPAPKPPTVKVTVSHQAPTSARAMAGAAAALGKSATKGQPAKPAAKKALPQVLGPNATHEQIGAFAQRIVGQQSQAQLIPLRQQAAQLANQQRTVSDRYAGYSQTDQGILSGLQAGQAASALTNENAQAQAAQQTANQIDASGKAAAALNAGYQGPEAQDALANTQQFQGGVQGAQAGYLAGQAGNNADLLTALRGTAALQAQQGQRDIASAYQKPIQTNVAAQQAVIAKQPVSSAALAQSLGQTAFQDRLLAKEYGLKQYAAKTDRQKAADAFALGQGRNMIAATQAGTAQTRAQTQQFSAQDTARYRAATVALGQAKLGSQTAYQQGTLAIRQTIADANARHQQATDRIAAIKVQLQKAGLSDKKRHELVTERVAQERVAASTKPGGKATSASTLKYVSLIEGGANLYKQSTSAKGTNAATGKPNAITPEQAAAHVNVRLQAYGPAAAASIDLATKGYVTPANVQKLKAIGVTLPAYMTTPPKHGGAFGAAGSLVNSAVGTAIKGAGG